MAVIRTVGIIVKIMASMVTVTSFAPLQKSQPTFIYRTDTDNSNESDSNYYSYSQTKANMIFGKKSQDSINDSNNSLTFNGKPIKAKAGDKVSVVASKAKIPITYSCRKGDCGTCEIMMNGLIVKACQAKIPSGKCEIKTF